MPSRISPSGSIERHGRPREAGETECSLAERQRDVELAVEGHGPGVEAFEVGAGGCVGACELDESPADVDAVDDDAAPGQGVGVASRSAADVEHPHARFEPEDVDQEVDLLLGAAGEGVPEVGRTEVVGGGLEPVIGFRGHGASMTPDPARPRRRNLRMSARQGANSQEESAHERPPGRELAGGICA